ncbi:MAG TPA: c-type cytochrome [Polyangiaceae bacterium]|nr:c-type cytochrome [Polyangiaceae bacterium]
MKNLVCSVSVFALLLACSSAEGEGTPAGAGGAIGAAGGGMGGALSGAGGQALGGTQGGVAGGGAAGTATAGSSAGGAAGQGGTVGLGGAGAGGSAGGGAGGGGGGGAGGQSAMSPEEALYTTHCSTCHGPSGEGGALGPEIRHPVDDFTLWMVRNGSEPRNPNSAFPAPMIPIEPDMLSDADLAMVISYLNSFPKGTTGEALYLDYCANCHGADGKGAQTTRDLTNLADPLATAVPDNVRGGHHPGEFNLLIEYMPAQDMSVLTDAELMLIASHIETL